MNLVDYKQAYDTDREVKEYVDKYARCHRTTVDVALKHKIVQLYIENKGVK